MLRSPPSRRRGLKCDYAQNYYKENKVASFAEAWIEIWVSHSWYLLIPSPPSRRRGLKYGFGRVVLCRLIRRLLRGGVD